MNIMGLIQNYFKDWLTRTGGVGAYTTFLIDLSEAHSEQGYNFSGDQIIIVKSDSKAYIKLNDKRNENIDTTCINQINTPFKMFYITNDVGTGLLEILVGTEGIFNSVPARINAVITDPEDAYGRIHQIGNAELAARLGALTTWDRRGNIIWYDTFENNINNWNLSYTGGGATDLSTARNRSGAHSMYLDVGTDVNDRNNCDYYIPFRELSKLGFEVSFCAESVIDDINSILFWIYWYDGVNVHKGEIKWFNNGLRYRNDIGGTTAFGTVGNVRTTTKLFHQIKIVIDPTDYTYERVLFDNKEFNITNIPLQASADASIPAIQFGFYIQNSTLNNHTDMYIDNVIITQNEP